MASAKYIDLIDQSDDPGFDVIHNPGAVAPASGVYRCLGCGVTAVAERFRKLPPQNHHQHSPAQGEFRWRLLVATTHTNPSI